MLMTKFAMQSKASAFWETTNKSSWQGTFTCLGLKLKNQF